MHTQSIYYLSIIFYISVIYPSIFYLPSISLHPCYTYTFPYMRLYTALYRYIYAILYQSYILYLISYIYPIYMIRSILSTAYRHTDSYVFSLFCLSWVLNSFFILCKLFFYLNINFKLTIDSGT